MGLMSNVVMKLFYRMGIAIMLLITFSNPVNSATPHVYDHAKLFTDSERDDLEQQATTLSEQVQLDIAVVTIDDNAGKTAEENAMDFFDEHDLGNEDGEDSVLLLIDMDGREVFILTSGLGSKYLTDQRLDLVLDDIYPYLSEQNYTSAVEFFLTGVNEYVQQGIPADQHTVVVSEKNETSLAYKLLVYLGISSVIGLLVVGGMATKNRSTSSISKGTYLLKDSFRLIRHEDRHYNTKVTKRRIQTQSSSGSRPGRSTVRSSSSGRSYGGRGRKF